MIVGQALTESGEVLENRGTVPSDRKKDKKKERLYNWRKKMNHMKMKTRTIMMMVTLILVLFVSACSPKATPEPTLDANMIFTQAAITVAAKLTSTALSMPTATPTATLAPTNTQMPPTATSTAPSANTTPIVAGSATLAPNPNKMEFVGDVTIPDGQVIPAGSKFIKTWRIKNIGTTTWAANYKIRNWAGFRYGADASILLGKEVKPNETTEISIEFTAPLNNGEYTSWWILSDADEANFGQTFYVKFVVGVAASPTNTQVPPATATATEAPSATP